LTFSVFWNLPQNKILCTLMSYEQILVYVKIWCNFSVGSCLKNRYHIHYMYV
jgi:hypothetical protein